MEKGDYKVFTGIVKEKGTVIDTVKKDGKVVLFIKGKKSSKNTKIDESVAVNGCCLTAVSVEEDIMVFDVLPESLKLTNLGQLKHGDKVNLETALTLQDKLGGHILQGHVDCKAKLIKQEQEGSAIVNYFEMEEKYINQLIPKGFVAINGISLTIVDIKDNHFSVMIIPHTFNNTQIDSLKIGDYVNIEIDFMTKTIINHLNKIQEVKK